MLKALIFDMDGVIIDSEPIHTRIAMEVMKDFGGAPTQEEIYEFVGVTNKEMWGILRERHGLNATVDELLARHREHKMKRFLDEPIPPIDGIVELVRRAKGMNLKIALATSSPSYFARHILENAELAEYFDAMVTADDITHGKPDPEIYLKAAERLGVEPACCVAVEDAFFGIQAAKDAGMRVVAFSNPNSGEQDTSRADFVVSSIRDIHLESL